MLFVCYPKCTTCQKAKKWLDEKEISYTLRDIKTENPTQEELRAGILAELRAQNDRETALTK